MLGNIRNIWEEATLEEREAWFKLMFNKVYVKNGVIKAIEPTPVMSALFDTPGGSDGIRTRVGYRGVIIVPYGTPFEEIQRLLLLELY